MDHVLTIHPHDALLGAYALLTRFQVTLYCTEDIGNLAQELGCAFSQGHVPDLCWADTLAWLGALGGTIWFPAPVSTDSRHRALAAAALFAPGEKQAFYSSWPFGKRLMLTEQESLRKESLLREYFPNLYFAPGPYEYYQHLALGKALTWTNTKKS